ncbi:hypothetical protein [Streptomyces sp. NPDC002758]
MDGRTVAPAYRHRLAVLLMKAAEQVTAPEARALMLESPESFGLVEDTA